MGNTLPGVSEVNGFQPENLLGPPANLVSQFLSGGLKVAAGDTAGLRNFVPSAAKKVVDMIGGEGKMRDYRDREVLDPTPGEKLGAVLGFNPKRLSDFNVASRISALNDKVEGRREGEFRQQLGESVVKQLATGSTDFRDVFATLKQRAQQEPGYDLENAVRGIAKAAEELTFPRDLRREGTGSNRNRLLDLWNIDPNKPTEVSRLLFRKQIEARFGLTGASKQALQMAQVVDQLQARNPGLSRAEAKSQAEAILKKQGTSSVLLE